MLTEVDLQIGYRVRDEICFYLIYAVKSGVFTFDQAFDFQILQKVLPRISGSDAYTFDLLKIFIITVQIRCSMMNLRQLLSTQTG